MISRTERLEREKVLITAAKAGDKAAMQELIISVRPLIWKLINQNRSRIGTLDEHDLEQSAYCYTIHAVHKFDLSRGLLFITYATHWIKHGIQLLIRQASKLHKRECASVEELFIESDEEGYYERLEDTNAVDALQKLIQENDYNDSLLTSLATQVVKERLPNHSSIRDNPGLVADIVLLRWLSDSPASLAELGEKYSLSRTTLSTIERAMKEEIAQTIHR